MAFHDMTGVVIIVTGAATGMGAIFSRHLASQGAIVVLADVQIELGQSLADGLRTEGLQAFFHPADVADEDSLARMAAWVSSRFGKIDALVNNAAIYQGLGAKRSFVDISVSEWDRVMAVNARGVWLAIRSVYSYMKEAGYGRVVNIASSTVHVGAPFFAHYTASKGAVIAITRSIAREVGRDGITVNAIAPGLVDNESSATLNEPAYLRLLAQQRAIPRRMTPTDLTGPVTFLCSPASEFVTGQTLIVDGGLAFN